MSSSNVTRFLRAVTMELRWRLGLSVLLALVLALAEGVGLLLLVPLLGSIGLAVSDGATGGLATAVESIFAALGLRTSLVTVLGIFAGVSIAHAFLHRAHLLLNPALEQQFVLALRGRLYAAIVRSDWSFFASRRATDFVHAVTTEVDRAGSAGYQLLNLVAGLAITSVYLAVAAVLSPLLTLLAAGTGLAILWWQRGRTRRSSELGESYSEANRRQFHMASESIVGLKVARSFTAEGRDAAIFAGLARERSQAYLRMLRSFAGGKLAMDVASAVVISALLLIAVGWLRLSGAALLVLLFAFARILPRVVSLQHAVQLVAAGVPSFTRVMRLIDDCEANAETEEPRTAYRGPRTAYRVPAIQLDSVTYAYPAGGTVLHDVSLSIPAGHTTAIVGASGAGKSTVADLLLGLLRPVSGTILVDGRPLPSLDLLEWRRAVGYVPQDSFLLHDTIRANLQWANPAASEADMWAALAQAAADGFVRARPEALDTVVGDRGVQLSGGERQRLALARALLVRPALLILDEATSALDAANEQKILAAVATLAGSVTTIIITHRLSAIRAADSIHVLEQGALVESGTWDELVERGRTFAALLAAQDTLSPSSVVRHPPSADRAAV